MKILQLSLILLSFMFPFSAKSNAPLNLDECYQAALKRSEDLANQEELISQAEERFVQARGAILPTINGIASYLIQPPPSGLATISPPNQRTVRITGTQPLFRGFREYAALRQQKNLVEVGQFNRDQAKIQIFMDLLLNFYQVLSLEQDLVNIKGQVKLYDKRIAELNRFRQLGRSRESEVLMIQASLASLEAQEEAVRSQLKNLRDIFEFFTGLDRNTPIVDTESMSHQVSDMDVYLTRIDHRPDIRALIKSVEASEEGVKIAKGGHLPSLDLTGNYYFQRPGFLSNVNWDVFVGLTMPIFQGGLIRSQVKVASSVQHQTELSLSKGRRQAEQQIKSLFDIYLGDLSQLEKLKRAVDLTRRNYQSEVRDYQLGLVTNLEVLQALTAFQENLRAMDKMKFQLRADSLNLQAAAAIRP